MQPLTVINLFGSPGTGKSTTASGLFYLMKLAGCSVELVTEFAKDLVWAEHHKTLAEETLLIFGEQNHRLNRLRGKVEFAITDSPLPTALFYMPKDFPASFSPFAMDIFNSYNNINFFMTRTKKYNPIGRNQTEEESDQIAKDISLFLWSKAIPHITTPADGTAPHNIYEVIASVVSTRVNNV